MLEIQEQGQDAPGYKGQGYLPLDVWSGAYTLALDARVSS